MGHEGAFRECLGASRTRSIQKASSGPWPGSYVLTSCSSTLTRMLYLHSSGKHTPQGSWLSVLLAIGESSSLPPTLHCSRMEVHEVLHPFR